METLHYLLMKAYTNLNRWLMAQASTLGLSPGQPKILECLIQNGEVNQKAIASSCEIEPATVGSILSRMERDGLVRRRQRNGDRRSLYVSLTPGRCAWPTDDGTLSPGRYPCCRPALPAGTGPASVPAE